MTLRLESSLINPYLSSVFELLFDHQDQKPLSVDLGDLNVAMRISIKEELGGNGSRKSCEKRSRGLSQSRDYMGLNFPCELFGQDFIDLSNENANFRYELNEPLWDQDHTVFFTSLRSFANDVSDLHSDILKRHMFGLNFLADESAIDSGLESTFQDNVRS